MTSKVHTTSTCHSIETSVERNLSFFISMYFFHIDCFSVAVMSCFHWFGTSLVFSHHFLTSRGYLVIIIQISKAWSKSIDLTDGYSRCGSAHPMGIPKKLLWQRFFFRSKKRLKEVCNIKSFFAKHNVHQLF